MRIAVRILYISPSGGSAYAEGMAAMIDRARSPGTIVDYVSVPDDRPSHLEYHSYEANIVRDLVHIAHAWNERYDAIITGGYYDIALREMREVSGNAVVIGPCQATTAIASVLGNTFSVLVGRRKWIDRMRANVRHYGHRDRMVSMRAVELSVHDFQARGDAADRLLSVGRRCVEEDGAEVLILGCTVEYGFSDRMREALQVPVIEAIPAAVRYAEMLGGAARKLDWHPSRAGSSKAPPMDEMRRWNLYAGEPPVGFKRSIGESVALAASV